MSTEALEAKKQQAADYYTYHPESQTVSIVGTDNSFPGLFDYAFKAEQADSAGASQLRRSPRILFYSGYRDLITGGVTKVTIGGKTYAVANVHTDESTYQGELWLV